MTKPPIVNKHDGPCRRCGTKVPAGTGTYDYSVSGCLHPDGACNTTTKTYQRHLLQAEATRRAQQPVPAPLALQYRRAEVRNFLKARFEPAVPVTDEMVDLVIAEADAEHELEGRVS